MLARSQSLVLLLALATLAGTIAAQEPAPFKAGVELVNVTATVTDDDGRFVPNLTKEDFSVSEDGQPQDIVYFDNVRVPVSLGLLLDVSGSMTRDKMEAARAAIDRFIFDLLGPEDELFFMEFASRARLLQDWTKDKAAISQAVRRVYATGGTAMFDAVAEAIPIAERGSNRKKALLIISDGNDTDSRLLVGQLRQMIRESEVLVYALGIDGDEPRPTIQPRPPRRLPFPMPIPGQPGGRLPFPFPQIRLPQGRGGGGGGTRWPSPPGARVDADALRLVTDDTGGRTELVRVAADLTGATERIANELSKQYALGYVSTGQKDGRWHAIRVTVRGRAYTVRSRRGYIAS